MIENRALGYRIQYFLHEFIADGDRTSLDGAPLFEELTSDDAGEMARWVAERKRAFDGSPRQFLQAILQGHSEGLGYITYRVDRPSPTTRQSRSHPRFIISPRKFVSPGRSPREMTLAFGGYIEVIYRREKETKAYLKWHGMPWNSEPSNQRSWLRLPEGTVTIDRKGNVLDPYGITYYGYMAFEYLADMLPEEYRLP